MMIIGKEKRDYLCQNQLIMFSLFSSSFQGGFDMICSGRDKIETPEQVSLSFASQECDIMSK